MFDPSHVNYMAILVAAIAGMAIGFLWYSKLMFAEMWTKEAKPKSYDSNANVTLYLVNYLVYFVMAYALSQLIFFFDLRGVVEGMLAGVFAFTGFAGAAAFTENLFSGRSWKLFAINYGYQLVNLVVMGIVLAVWR